MRIGIIGAGAMAGALGGGWAAAGHDVCIGARSREAAQALATRINASRMGDTADGAESALPPEADLSTDASEPRSGTGRSSRASETHSTIGRSGASEVWADATSATAGAPSAVGAESIGAAMEWADIVLLAVPVGALAELLGEHGDALADKVVIDCTNAFLPDESAPDGTTAFVLSEDAVAERIAAGVPKAHVVKAFNLLAAEVWAGTDRVFDGARLAVPICGDDPAAVRTVATLAEDLALQPFPAGGLHRAKYLEATSVFAVGLWFAGADARAMLPPLSAAFAVAD
ncbi:NADPH-dependent F420 reductase [Nocardia neocaledoniensis]|uniref:NADPH-dependent F420 reductase n=1 Tax=Nocardia neocaledoniensis TaxID=236511 RepID=UPI002458092A|nr:NAD(P)-binding domain-containing protein [Nocardia neocaledoniensis]